MNKEQTFISILEDKDGNTIDFERWSYKKVAAVEKKVKKLYNDYYGVYKEDIEKWIKSEYQRHYGSIKWLKYLMVRHGSIIN